MKLNSGGNYSMLMAKQMLGVSLKWRSLLFPVNTHTYEPRHDKTNKVTVRPAKIQISLGIRPVWSESSLCVHWVAKDARFLHADSEDSDQTGRMPRLAQADLSLRWVHSHFVGFVMSRLSYTVDGVILYLLYRTVLSCWSNILCLRILCRSVLMSIRLYRFVIIAFSQNGEERTAVEIMSWPIATKECCWIEPATVRISGGPASDRAIAPGCNFGNFGHYFG